MRRTLRHPPRVPLPEPSPPEHSRTPQSAPHPSCPLQSAPVVAPDQPCTPQRAPRPVPHPPDLSSLPYSGLRSSPPPRPTSHRSPEQLPELSERPRVEHVLLLEPAAA